MAEPTLPFAAWQERDDLQALLRAIDPEGNACRYVGGAVRDTFLGMDVADIDIATRLLPDQIIEKGEAAGLRMVPTGIAHGTVTAALVNGPVEITTLRRDVSTDGRHATVAFSTEWKDDAARRDFTINALYADPKTGAVSDYFGGLDDLEARRVRFIGDASERIREDYLRIMRFFRFTARFGQAEPDALALAACAKLASGMKALSRERISMELLAILALPDPIQASQNMARAGIWPQILPEMADNGLAHLAEVIRRETAHGLVPDALARLSALIPANTATVEKTAARLRLSKAKTQSLTSLAKARLANEADIPTTAWREGVDQARRLVLLKSDDQDVMKWLRWLSEFSPPPFVVKGGELIAAGVQPGPEVARILKLCEKAWIAAGFPDEVEQRAIMAQVIGQEV